MYRHRFPVMVFLFTIHIFFSSLRAWDGKRQGFIMGIGTGLGMTVTNVREVTAIPLLTEPATISPVAMGLPTNLKIGFAPNDQLQIYYSQMSSSLFPLLASYGNKYAEALKFEHISDIAVVFLSPFFFPLFTSHIFPGLGCTYYFSPKTPGYFLNGGIGLSVFRGAGIGFSAGGGYKFKRHANVSLDFFGGSGLRDPNMPPSRSNTASIICTINILGY